MVNAQFNMNMILLCISQFGRNLLALDLHIEQNIENIQQIPAFITNNSSDNLQLINMHHVILLQKREQPPALINQLYVITLFFE